MLYFGVIAVAIVRLYHPSNELHLFMMLRWVIYICRYVYITITHNSPIVKYSKYIFSQCTLGKIQRMHLQGINLNKKYQKAYSNIDICMYECIANACAYNLYPQRVVY